jgi:hypothetical protein
MTRNQFFKRVLAGLTVAAILPKTVEAEGNPVFNIEKLKARKAEIERMTPEQIHEAICEYQYQININWLKVQNEKLSCYARQEE